MLEDLRTEIEELRAAALPLEPDADARRELGGQALDHVLADHGQVETASSHRPWSEVFAQRQNPEFNEQGRDPARAGELLAHDGDEDGERHADQCPRRAP